MALAPGFNKLHAKNQNLEGPKRFIFIRKSNGLRPHELALPSFSQQEKSLERSKSTFEADLDKHELPKWMRVLDKHKEHMTILQGISATMIENGHYSHSSTLGAFHSKASSPSALKRVTVDYELGFLNPSPFTSVELSLVDNRKGIVPGFSVPSLYQRNSCYADPETAFNQVFKCVLDPKSVESDTAMINFHKSQLQRALSKVKNSKQKRALLNRINSFDEMIKRNNQLASKATGAAKYMPELNKVHADGGFNATTPQKQAAMTDVLVAAMASGLTNVVSYVMDTIGTSLNGFPGIESATVNLHALGHNASAGGLSNEGSRAVTRISHLDQINSIIEKLKTIPEGKGNMFDNTMIFYFPSGGETHHSKGLEMPYIIMSGKNCNLDIAGRYIRLPYLGSEGHKTIGNFYTTLLNAHGNSIEHYGDLCQTMSRKNRQQTGAIKRFLT